MRNFKLVWVGLFAAALVGGALLQWRWQRDMDVAKNHYFSEHHSETVRHAAQIDFALGSIYQNLRTLASMPSVREVDRHARNFGPEANAVFQLIYNNLAESVGVSEVYVLPIDFDPEKIDPVTFKTEEPIIAFDQLIANAGSGVSRIVRQTHPVDTSDPGYTGPKEIEAFEYKQLVEHAQWLKQHYPTVSDFEGLKVPFISGSEVITCDNTQFIKTSVDKDRSGLIFSVPFYGLRGEIKGMISGIILTSAMRDLLKVPNLALINTSNNYAVLGDEASGFTESTDAIRNAQPDPQLAYSEAVTLGIADSRSQWQVWAGKSAQDFKSSSDVASANNIRQTSLLALILVALAASAALLATQRNLSTAEYSATQLQMLNNDISNLNGELATKLKQLSEAQDAIVKNGRMAQLGQLVATVAHEIRNPLGSIRTTSFALKRRLMNEKIDLSAQIMRIETSVRRCDRIISQLLDFSRMQEAQLEKLDICQWLQSVIEEEIVHWPEAVSIELHLPEGGLVAQFDPERLRRCVVNMVTNASEALVNNKVPTPNPKVSITAAKTPRGYEIIFLDNGPGIPPDIVTKIGEPLFTTKNFGTGLGIAATRKVAELHGGGLDISSELGKGARFAVWIANQESVSIAA